ncbi:MAG: hypothetical protein AAB402_00030 [Patescibacteria group bacterium]
MNWSDILWLVVLIATALIIARKRQQSVPPVDESGRLTTFPARW